MFLTGFVSSPLLRTYGIGTSRELGLSDYLTGNSSIKANPKFGKKVKRPRRKAYLNQSSCPLCCSKGNEYTSGPNDINGSDPFPAGTLLADKYKILGVLGRGSSGITYEAEQLVGGNSGGQLVALKVLSIRGMKNWKSLDLFEREGKILQTLTHPAIPDYIDSFQVDTDEDLIYVLVQRKASGTTLQQLIDNQYRFQLDQIFSILKQLLEVLDYLGSLVPPVLHRDVKPSNILLDRNENGRQADFHLSLVDFGGVNTGRAMFGTMNGGPGSTLVGTFGYMAPEQFSGYADIRSDLYAAGATVLYAITGVPPSELPRKRLKIDWENVMPERERSKLGPLLAVIIRLLEPAPEDRFDSAQQALRALVGGAPEAPTDKAARAYPFPNLATVLGNDSILDRENMESLSQRLELLLQRNRNIKGGQSSGFGLGRLFGSLTQRMSRKPAGTRVMLHRSKSDRLLCVSIPPRGVSTETVSRGAFALAWNGIVGLWTVGILSGGGPLLFSLFSIPFWVAGVQLAKSTIDDIRGTTSLIISRGGGQYRLHYFALFSSGAFGRPAVVEGDSRDLDGVAIETQMYVNGSPVNSLVLREGTRTHLMSDSLMEVEQKWLRDEINYFLSSI